MNLYTRIGEKINREIAAGTVAQKEQDGRMMATVVIVWLVLSSPSRLGVDGLKQKKRLNFMMKKIRRT